MAEAGKLRDRIAIVTGASSGIGAAIAKAFAREGATVVIAARRADRLTALAGSIAAEGGVALARETDARVEADIEGLFALVDERFGRLDLLVNSAGVADHTPTVDLSLARWQDVVDTNLTSTFLCCRAAMRRMVRQKRGRIINIGSISAKSPRPNAIAYTSTKFAMEGLTRSLALDGRDHGVTVSILHPGSTVTELVPGMDRNGPEQSMNPADVAAIATLMAALPDGTNFMEALALPIAQPFLGRG
jgi:NAD(P)-dependent dehydrogenase (short-subunit alcohol dehydrogenase family)